ncbi:MAG TPA: hypothetical protein VK196_03665 [Magnetospirillum sp.]|nr:hypothetical protein [Magnetospirillum sp.]
MDGADEMVGQIFDDVRRILLSLLFVVAFGWMAAQVVPGQMAGADAGVQVAQLDKTAEIIPPKP